MLREKVSRKVGKSIASVIAPKSPTEPHGSPIPKTVKPRSLVDVAANENLQRTIPSFNPHSPKNGSSNNIFFFAYCFRSGQEEKASC